MQLIEKEYNNGKSKKGFEYEHPLLPKLKKYPLSNTYLIQPAFAWT